MPIHSETIVIGQSIHDHQSVTYFNLLNNFKLGFSLTATYLLSFLGILALSFLFNGLTYEIRFGERQPIKITKKIALATNSFRTKRLSAIGMYFLFVRLFLWITQLFLINNIKTNKVVRLLSAQTEMRKYQKLNDFDLGC